jgi:competence protein ComEC
MQIDRLMLSHRDSDHVGGAASVLAGIRVIDSASSLETGHALLERLPRHRRCEAGQAWAWDGVRFEILHPPALSYEAPAKPNASSCVLKVTDALGRSALLTGDIEAAQEAALVERAGAALQSDLLLVPHHGSRTSSSPAFLAAVRPQIAVTQAAYRSRFGHPAPAVLARYRAQGIGVVRSDRCGAFHWKPGEGDQRGVCERERRRRYWHHPAGAEPVPR